jgi:hypothetical protein
MDDVAEIVAGLSEAQRRTLLESKGFFALARNWPNRHKMIEKRLAFPTSGKMRLQITALGLAVRAHLNGE